MTLTHPTILVADDDPLSRLFVRNALEPAGMTVIEAMGGKDALTKFETLAPDLVVLDIMMPDIDGYLTCSRLRTLPRGKRVPILILTGLDDANSIAQAYEHGATDFITKPVNATILCHHVRYMLRTNNVLHALIRSESRLELAQRIARIGNWDWNPGTNRFTMSNELCRLVGIRPHDFSGTFEAFLNFVHPDDRPVVNGALEKLIAQHTPCDIDHRVMLPNGTDFIIHLQAEGVREEETGELTVIGTAQDITERKQAERAIHRLAYYDSLTGLANRVLFKDRLSNALSYAERHHQHLATLFIDLDRFKVINDTLGHTVGDRLLTHVAERLSESVRLSDSVGRHADHEPPHALARLGGDEFTILLTALPAPEDAGRVARRILESLAHPFSIDGHEIFISASIGISIFPTDGSTVEALLKNADTAMYHAKEQGRNNCQFYSSGLNAAAAERLDLENELRRALEREEFLVYYQPKLNIHSRKILGAEALVRWKHPKRGVVPPGVFLNAAIDTGLIRPMDEWVLREACRQVKAWEVAGLPPITVSANVSNSLFHGRTLPTTVADALRDSGLNASQLELELTESIAMRDVEASVTMLEGLRTMGVRLSIDDFGTGYSSLSYLQRFPLSRLKIDQSFVRDLLTNENNVKITRAIIAMAHSLNLSVLAEGVETEGQLEKLREEGCDEVQGYLFSRPVCAEDFERLLKGDADVRTAA
ncbi:MAG: EAL domain-containing protein [Nitrospira sp.]|jgi:diguanylate cyclase (GGDEF)-like protein/PAS domain S-box-containing protein|nr:EAL domain-containing protein [Nitrospira sp.]MBP6605473.1 EAL domain-containing protein [Nitrospira sp.]MCI1278696.1 EAL domain-containing protein [Nitrospira sp.]HQY59450.1 EAL domain-containing protein [Nitrospira sp.]HRA96755.1 EAL domain-containing protein [Nitrospira sp.]